MFYRRNARPHRRQRTIASVLAAGLLVSGSLIGANTALAADPVVTPIDVTTSSNSAQASVLFDGNTGAPSWDSARNNDDATPWVMYDLEDAYTITSINAYWEGAYATRYIIVGWDGTQWLPLKKVIADSQGSPDAITNLAYGNQKFRYVGVAVEARRNADWGVKLYELQVMGTDPETSSQAAPTESLLDYLGAPKVPAGATNLAVGKTATGSSNNKPASNAIDGDLTTAWQATQNDSNETLTIDLQGTASVSAITVDPEAAYAKAFTVETSVNGWNDWTTFATVTGASQEHTVVVPENGGSVTARYVRITTDTRAMIYGTSFYEVGVWGDASTYVAAPAANGEGQNVGTLLSYGKDVVVPHSESGYDAKNVVDNDLASRWSTDPAQTWQNRDSWDGTAWLAIDLGDTPTALNQISMRWNPAYAAGYTLYVSNASTFPGADDKSAWTEIYATAAGKGKKDTVNLPDPSITGRWVLIKMTKEGPAGDGNFYGYSLFEVRVYGDVPPGFPLNTPAPDANQDATSPDFNNLVTVWEDNFDGAAGTLPSADNWTLDPAAAGQNNSELQAYTTSTDNIYLNGDGKLVIKAIKNEDGTYTSGRLNTSRKAHVQYGRIEARAKVPTGKGLWPAFWMMGENFLDGTEWPTNGEIDIMEVLGHDTETLHNTIHGPGYSGMGGVGGSYDAGVDLSEDFHTFGVDWDKAGLRFWLDDPANVTRSIPLAKVEDELGAAWVYDQPFFMILNLAVGGDWPGSPNADTQFPAELLVDYVRVSQSTGSGQLVTDGFSADPRTVELSVDTPATVVYGASTQVSVTATSGRTASPSGDVTVNITPASKPAARISQSFTVRMKNGTATFDLPALAVGTYDVTISYEDPNGTLFDATHTTALTVTPADSALTVDLGSETIARVEPVVAVIRIAPQGKSSPTGTVKVVIDGDISDSVKLTEQDNGVAVLRMEPRKTTGSKNVTISYSGDDNNSSATLTASHSARALRASDTEGSGTGTDTGTGTGSGSGTDSGTDTGSGIGTEAGTVSDSDSGDSSGATTDGSTDTGTDGSDSKGASSGYSAGSETSASTVDGPLALTGASLGSWSAIAAFALLTGGGLVLIRRRKHLELS